MPKKKFRVIVDGEAYEVEVEVEEGLSDIEILQRAFSGGSIRKEEQNELSTGKAALQERGIIVSPITGRVVEVRVRRGDDVTEDTIVSVLESMKTQVEVKAGIRGRISAVYVREGGVVKQGEPMFKVE